MPKITKEKEATKMKLHIIRVTEPPDESIPYINSYQFNLLHDLKTQPTL